LKSDSAELKSVAKLLNVPTASSAIQRENQQIQRRISELIREYEDRTRQAETNLANKKSSSALNGHPTIVACLNMDMVGRMDKQLVLQGIGSSRYWAGAIEQANAIVGLPVKLSEDTQLPTDATSFYRAGVPILSAFTGSHVDYHTPRDTPEKLNYPDAARIAKLMGLIARGLVIAEQVPDYIKQSAQPKSMATGSGRRARLGSVPNYTDTVKQGVLLDDVATGGPAETAGVKAGDIVVELAGKKIENIYDYQFAIESLKAGRETTIVVLRDGKRIELKITPGSAE
jgi:hypothetical protein